MTIPEEVRPGGASQDTRDLVRGTLTNLVGMVARIARPLTVALTTNLFGAALFGLYDTAWKIIFIILKVARFGLQQSVTRAVVGVRAAGDEEGSRQAIASGMVLALVAGSTLAVAVQLGAPLISRFYGQTGLVAALRIMAWSLVPLGLSTVLLAATRALRIVKYDVYVHSVGEPLLLLAGTLAAGLAGWGLAGLAGVQVGASAGVLALSFVYFRRHFSLAGFRRCWGNWVAGAPLARFSLPIMLSDVLTTAVWSIDQFILLKYVPAASVGVYAVMRQVSLALKKAPQAFQPIYSPIVAELSVQRRTEELEEHLAFIFRWVLLVNLLYLGGLVLVGDRALDVFGTGFDAGLSVAWLLCAGVLAFGLALPLENQLVMSGHPYLNLLDNSLWFAGTLGLSLWLIPVYGPVGAALASSLAVTLTCALRLVQIRRLQGIQPFRRQQLKPLVAVLCALAAGGLVKHASLLPSRWSMIPELAAFLGVAGLALWGLGLEAEDRLLIGRIRERLSGRRSAASHSKGDSHD